VAFTVVVRSSRINGLRVFALMDVSADEIILAIDDSRIVDHDRPLMASADERYCDYLEGGKIVLMMVPERHINHSCDPNVYVRTVNGRRLVIALRAIQAQEEIVYDYCINGSGDTLWHCECGSARCRKLIHSNFFRLPLSLQREYLPLLDEWFYREHAANLTELQP